MLHLLIKVHKLLVFVLINRGILQILSLVLNKHLLVLLFLFLFLYLLLLLVHELLHVILLKHLPLLLIVDWLLLLIHEVIYVLAQVLLLYLTRHIAEAIIIDLLLNSGRIWLIWNLTRPLNATNRVIGLQLL